MVSWFKKKNDKMQKVALSGDAGTISVPADFIVQEEDDSTVLAYPPGEEKITFRFSCLALEKKDDDESAGRAFVKKKAQEEGLNYFEIKDKGVLSYEEETAHEGTPLCIQYWEAGAGNTIVIVSATIIKAKRNDKTVKEALQAVHAMLESLKITKFHKVIEGNGGEVSTGIRPSSR